MHLDLCIVLTASKYFYSFFATHSINSLHIFDFYSLHFMLNILQISSHHMHLMICITCISFNSSNFHSIYCIIHISFYAFSYIFNFLTIVETCWGPTLRLIDQPSDGQTDIVANRVASAAKYHLIKCTLWMFFFRMNADMQGLTIPRQLTVHSWFTHPADTF